VHQEFYISVTPLKEDEYLIRTEQVSSGVPHAEEIVTWNVDEWLSEASQLMNDPLLGLLRGNVGALASSRSGLMPEVDFSEVTLAPSLVDFGQKLYNALFEGRIRDSWVTAQGIAQNRRDGLRLRLGLKGDRLQRLPWEVLHAGNRPLATGTDVVFSRYQSTFAPMGNGLQLHQTLGLEQNEPLRILMVLAGPSDQDVLQLEQEAKHLREELLTDSGSSDQAEIELTILPQPGRELLTQELEHGHYHVLHYAGHSDLSASGGDVYLVSDKTGLQEVLSGDDLAGLLVNNGIRLAVFNSCRGVYAATADPQVAAEAGNLADALLKRGIPAVLAMAERIPDDVALNLSRMFYRSLKQGSPIDLSLSRARQGLISSYSSNQLYWALPVLYLHPEFNGYLQTNESAGHTPNLLPGHEEDPLFDFLDTEFPGRFDEEADDDARSTVSELFQTLLPSSMAGATPRGGSANSAVLPRPDPLPKPGSVASGSDNLLDPFLSTGTRLYSEGDFASAIAVYREALKIDPYSASLYENLGLALQAYGQFSEAVTAFRIAVTLAPNSVSATQHLEAARQQATLTGLTVEPVAQPADLRKSGGMKGPSLPLAKPPVWRQPKVLVGASAALLLALGGFGWAVSQGWASGRNGLPGIPPLPVQTLNGPTNSPEIRQLTATATQSFAQNNIPAGVKAVATLLDQQALAAAKQAIENLPATQVSHPDVQFIRGRLAWQTARLKKADFSLDDARRDWEGAVKGNPNPLYYNMLGLALYTEGNLEGATQNWVAALKLLENQPGQTGEQAKLPNVEVLHARAGLALIAFKQAEKQSGSRRDDLMRQAIAWRNEAMSNSPGTFQPNPMWKDWRWSEVAIKDWQKLMAVK
jgi:tetratricopeptide (TPR) repeat protein